METFVLRWTKDNLPFWQGVDGGEKIEINAIADVINENAHLEAQLKFEKQLVVAHSGKIAELTKRLWDYEHQASDERIRDEK